MTQTEREFFEQLKNEKDEAEGSSFFLPSDPLT